MSDPLSHPRSRPFPSPTAPGTRTPTNLADPVMTGFPGPAADARPPDDPLDLLIRRPAATFWSRITGDGLAASGIRDGDPIAFDRGAAIRPGRWVLAESPAGFAAGLRNPSDGMSRSRYARMKSSRHMRLARSVFTRKLSGKPPRSQRVDSASTPTSGSMKGVSS